MSDWKITLSFFLHNFDFLGSIFAKFCVFGVGKIVGHTSKIEQLIRRLYFDKFDYAIRKQDFGDLWD